MKKEIKEIIKISERLNWSVGVNGNEFSFEKYSPAGQDFIIEIQADNLEDIVGILKARCEDFDCSAETYLWLDNSGHGTNGAPYDMKDLYEDMEACLEMMEELRDELIKINE